jgi:hypothetical protein
VPIPDHVIRLLEALDTIVSVKSLGVRG